MSHYYPIFLDLRGKSCLVVGAGEVASGKIPPLLNAGAHVTVVAPWLHPDVEPLVEHPNLNLYKRTFRAADLDNRFLVIAATDQPEVNRWVHQLGEAQQMLVNVADDTPHCNFILPSIAHAGPLKVAVSTAGTSPTLARRLRETIQRELLTPELANLARFLGEWRGAINPLLPSFQMKKTYWQRVLASRVPHLLATGRMSGAVAQLQACLDKLRSANGLERVTITRVPRATLPIKKQPTGIQEQHTPIRRLA